MAITEDLAADPEVLDPHQVLIEAVNQGVQEALEGIDQNFGTGQNPENQLLFHNTGHTDEVIERGGRIIATVDEVAPGMLTDRVKAILPLNFAFHDTVQDFDLVEREFEGRPTLIRVRHTGDNERASIAEELDFMNRQNIGSPTGEDLFTAEDKRLANASIEGTIPGFSPEAGTVIQPHRARNGFWAADILPLADLGAAGMDGPDHAIKDGDLNFLEENVDFTRLLQSGEPIDVDTKAWLHRRIVAFSQGQAAFVQGRQQLLDDDLANFPPLVAEALKTKIFTQFEASIAACQHEAEWRAQASPDEVLEKLRAYLPSLTPELPAA
jgi:hypothetical protein